MRTVPSVSVWDSVSEKMAMITIRRISPGIMILENFSIPFSTPRNTIQAVNARKISINTTGAISDVINDVKYTSEAASFPSEII